MRRVALTAARDEVILRKWNSGRRRWRVSLVAGLWRLEEKVAGIWCMARPSDDALALLEAFADSWVGNLRLQHRWARAEQKAAIATGDIEAAARWGEHVRSVRARIAALPEPYNEAPKEAA